MQNSKVYQLVKLPNSEVITGVHCLTTNEWIPVSEGNTDYQAYLQWLAEGNEPLPADEPETTE